VRLPRVQTMNYTIVMTTEADEDLAEAWMAAADPAAVTQAMYDAEQILSQKALSSSESLAEGLRRLKVEPILVYFRADVPLKLVEVLNIRLILSDLP
jgi:hypothetical protein